MNDLSGSWPAETPFGPVELQIVKDGSFQLGPHSGCVRPDGDSLEVIYGASGLSQ